MADDIALRVSSKTFVTGAQTLPVLRDIDLDVAPGEFVVIIGPSGCGKSTLLRLIAGLDTDFEGHIAVGGERVTGTSTRRGVVFQEPRLFPWLTVEQNIRVGLPARDDDVRRRTGELIDLVRLRGFEKSFPAALSGGMAQRTAIARSLIRGPELLLLDEPFSALDAFTRAHLQSALLRVWLEESRTAVLVTHDLDEAVTLANRVIVMNARPGTIRSVVPIDLSYPRRRTDPAFESARHDILRELESAYAVPAGEV